MKKTLSLIRSKSWRNENQKVNNKEQFLVKSTVIRLARDRSSDKSVETNIGYLVAQLFHLLIRNFPIDTIFFFWSFRIQPKDCAFFET